MSGPTRRVVYWMTMAITSLWLSLGDGSLLSHLNEGAPDKSIQTWSGFWIGRNGTRAISKARITSPAAVFGHIHRFRLPCPARCRSRDPSSTRKAIQGQPDLSSGARACKFRGPRKLPSGPHRWPDSPDSSSRQNPYHRRVFPSPGPDRKTPDHLLIRQGSRGQRGNGP